jgi:hypothetical protein
MALEPAAGVPPPSASAHIDSFERIASGSPLLERTLLGASLNQVNRGDFPTAVFYRLAFLSAGVDA